MWPGRQLAPSNWSTLIDGLFGVLLNDFNPAVVAVFERGFYTHSLAGFLPSYWEFNFCWRNWLVFFDVKALESCGLVCLVLPSHAAFPSTMKFITFFLNLPCKLWKHLPLGRYLLLFQLILHVRIFFLIPIFFFPQGTAKNESKNYPELPLVDDDSEQQQVDNELSVENLNFLVSDLIPYFRGSFDHDPFWQQPPPLLFSFCHETFYQFAFVLFPVGSSP